MVALRQLRAGKFSEDEIAAEFQAILVGIEKEKEKGTFLDIFRGRNLVRTLIVCGANFFLQSTGQVFASIYGAIFVRSIGTINPFTVTVILAVVNMCTAFLAMALLDRVGRRYVQHKLASRQRSSLRILIPHADFWSL
jgi:MFS transporter, SP family, sugar:H+ symporter